MLREKTGIHVGSYILVAKALVACAFIVSASLAAQSQQPRARAPVANEALAVQVMLDRGGFSPGEIDGRTGPNFLGALAAFQRANNLTAEPGLDAAWKRLTERAQGATQVAPANAGQPPLTTYTVTDDDVRGPFVDRIPEDLDEQSKLESLGYTSALEELSEKFHCNPTLLTSLNPGLTIPKAGDRLNVPNVEIVTFATTQPKAVATSGTAQPALTLFVRRATSALTLEDGDGHVVFHAPVTVGSEHDPLPVGTWKVAGIQRFPKFHYNPALFWDANPRHSKATLPPGPNSPVGVVWIDLSKPHYGIHGTSEPSRIGHSESHGCIRLTNWDAARVADRVTPWTRVIFE